MSDLRSVSVKKGKGTDPNTNDYRWWYFCDKKKGEQ